MSCCHWIRQWAAVAIAFFVSFSPVTAVAVDVQWDAPGSGHWLDYVNWSPDVRVDNDAVSGVFYDAQISDDPTDYVVTLDHKNGTVKASVAVDSLLLQETLRLGNGAALRIENNLTLDDGTILIGRVSGTGLDRGQGLLFSGDHVVDGRGNIVFDGTGTSSISAVGGQLVLGANVTIRTENGSGFLKYNYNNPFVVSQGLISSETAGDTITLIGVQNEGTVQAINGGNLALSGVRNYGAISVQDQGTLEVMIDSAIGLQEFENHGTLAATDSTVRIGGRFTWDQLGAYEFTNTDVAIFGTLENAGQQITTSSSARLVLDGGTIEGGTIGSSDSTEFRVGATGTLDGATLAADLTLDAGTTRNPQQLIILNGLTLAGSTVRLGMAEGGHGVGELTFRGDSLLAGTGEIVFDGRFDTNQIGMSPYIAAGTLTIGGGITIRSGDGNGTVGADGHHLVLQGEIAADYGQGIAVRGTTVRNEGVLRVGEDSFLSVHGLTGELGAIELAEGSTTTLLGDFVIDDLDIPVNADLRLGSQTLRGSISAAAGSTLELSNPNVTNAGVIDLDGASLDARGWNSSGTVRMRNGSEFTFWSMTLDPAHLGTFDRDATTTVRLVGSWIMDSSMDLAAFDGDLLLNSAYVRNSVLTSSTGASLVAENFAYLIDTTIDSSVQVVNKHGSLLRISNLTNQGSIENHGTVVLYTPSDVSQLTGISGPGTIEIESSFDALGQTIDLAAHGKEWVLQSSAAHWIGGRIEASDTVKFTTSDDVTFSGVELATDFLADEGSTVRFQDGLTLDGAIITAKRHRIFSPASMLQFAGDQTVSGTGSIRLMGNQPITIMVDGHVTLEAGVSLQYENGGTLGATSTSRLTNVGTITATGAGQTLTLDFQELHQNGLLAAYQGSTIAIAMPDWTNDGELHMQSGTFRMSGTTFTNSASGSITGTGTFDVSGVGQFINDGVISPGLSPGELIITGDVELGASSKLKFEIDGVEAGEFDTLLVQGNLVLGGVLELLVASSVGELSEPLVLIQADQIVGTFSNLDDGLISLADGRSAYVQIRDNAVSIQSIVPVPSPGSLALLCIGAPLLLSRRRSGSC